MVMEMRCFSVHHLSNTCIIGKEHSVDYVRASGLVNFGHFVEDNNFDSCMVKCLKITI